MTVWCMLWLKKFRVLLCRGKVKKRPSGEVQPKKIPERWVSWSELGKQGISILLQESKRMLETFTKAFIWLCKWKHSENMEMTEIQNGWNSKGEGGAVPDEAETKGDTEEKIANTAKEFFSLRDIEKHWRDSYFRKNVTGSNVANRLGAR